MKWTDDKFAESQMAAFGVKWKVSEIDIGQIDEKASLVNRARIGDPIRDDVVEDYALAMERGDDFPRLVVRFSGSDEKKGVIESGNHRFQAAKLCGVNRLSVYIVRSSDPQVIDLMPRVLNRGHGLRDSRDDAIANACYAVNFHKVTVQRASELFGITTKSINDQIRAEKIKALLDKGGVKTTKMGKTVLNRLNTLNTESVIISAGRVIAAGNLGYDDVGDFVSEIKANSASEASQMAVVAKYEQLQKENREQPVKHTLNVRVRFLMSLARLERIVKGVKKLALLQIEDEPEKELIKVRLNELSKKLSMLSGL